MTTLFWVILFEVVFNVSRTDVPSADARKKLIPDLQKEGILISDVGKTSVRLVPDLALNQ